MVIVHCPVCGNGHLVDAFPKPKVIPVLKLKRRETERIKMVCQQCNGRFTYYAGFETRAPEGQKIRRWSYYTKAPYLEEQQDNWSNRGNATLLKGGVEFDEVVGVGPTEGVDFKIDES